MPNEVTPAPAARGPASPASTAERAQVHAELAPMLAEMKARREANERNEAVEETEEKPAKPAAAKPAEGVEEKPDGEEPAPELDEAEAQAVAEEEGTPAKPDPKTSRGLEQVARAEKRHKQEVERAQAHLYQREAQLVEREKGFEQRLARAEGFEKRWKTDAFGVLDDMTADLPAADVEAMARQLFRRAKAGSDPAARAELERARRERDASTQAKTAAERVAELEKKLADRDAAVAREAEVGEYLTTVEAAVTAEQPLLARALKRNLKETRKELTSIAGYIAQQTGNPWPSPTEVAAAYETWKEHRLREELGDEAVAAVKKPAGAVAAMNGTTPKKPNPAAGETKRPMTISSDLGRTTQPQKRSLSWDEEKDLVAKELREGRANDGS